MSSNLPPGCSSADGGIDHEMESALDALADAIETPDEAILLKEILPALRLVYEAGFKAGEREGWISYGECLDAGTA